MAAPAIGSHQALNVNADIAWEDPITSRLVWASDGLHLVNRVNGIATTRTAHAHVETPLGLGTYLSRAGAGSIAGPLGFSLVGGATVEMWLRHYFLAGYTSIIDIVSSGATRHWSVFIDGSGNLSYIDLGGGTGSGTALGLIDTGEFWHFVTTLTPAGVANFYVNGVDKGALTLSAAPNSSTGDMNVGSNPSTGGTASEADTTVIRAWQRTLTMAEVEQLYADPSTILRR